MSNFKDFEKTWMILHKNLHKFLKSKNFKINKLDFRILQTIKANSDISANRIAEILELSRPRITVSINELANKGFIEINKDEKDKRKYNISLTNTGEKYLIDQHEFFSNFFQELWNEFDNNEKVDMLKLFTKTNSILEKKLKED